MYYRWRKWTKSTCPKLIKPESRGTWITLWSVRLPNPCFVIKPYSLPKVSINKIFILHYILKLYPQERDDKVRGLNAQHVLKICCHPTWAGYCPLHHPSCTHSPTFSALLCDPGGWTLQTPSLKCLVLPGFRLGRRRERLGISCSVSSAQLEVLTVTMTLALWPMGIGFSPLCL